MKKRICLLFLLAATLEAQSTSGMILGAVRDSSGAAVAAAKLTLRNLDENTIVTSVSGSLGLYEFVNLKPGRYEVTAERAGFGNARTPEIILDARQTRRADFTLEIAPRTDAVLVTASVPRVNTDNGTVADTKEFEQVTRLPINTRGLNSNPFTAIRIVPGVQADAANRFSIGGGLPLQIEYSVDGISTVDVSSHANADNLGPSPEMLQEFRVTSVNAGAALGPMADVTIVSRSGTNQFHGSALWYHQNRALDAKVWGAPQKQQKISNEFGASLGGPVEIPRVYHGRNRTFFFVDFEGNRRPQTTLVQKAYPPAAARQGDLSAAAGGPAVDPFNGAPFPGNRIPLNRINPVSTRLLDHYYPLPNITTPGAANNFLDLVNTSSSTNGYDVRGDHVISARQRLFARWSWKESDSIRTNAPLPTSDFLSRNQSLALGYTLSISARLFNEVRAGFGLPKSDESFPIRGRDAVAALGLVGLNLQNAGDTGGFPYFDFSERTSYAFTYKPRSGFSESRNYQFSDTLSFIRGRHIAKFGADFRRIGYRSVLHYGGGSDDFGGFYFSSTDFSRNAFADLLLGLPTQTYYAFVGPNVNEFANHASFFAADTWRVTSRLTIDLGLRWEVHPPMWEEAGNIATFDHSNGNVIVPDQSLPAAPGFLAAIDACPGSGSGCTKILTASQAGLPRTLRTTDYSDWNPRLGFAWQPTADGKTVVRGAIGSYTLIPLGGTAYAPAGVHSSDVRTIDNALDVNREPFVVLPNILPRQDALGAIGRETFLTGNDPRLRDPRSYQWNVTLERALPWRTTLRASYIGVQSTGIPTRVDFNQIPVSTQPFSWDRVPYRQWGYLGSVENVGFANYQGLQVEATRRLQNGVYFQASYTHSKNLGSMGSAGAQFFAPEATGIGVSDRFNTRYDRGDLSGARRDRFLLTAIVPLPFGKGRALGSGWRGISQALLGGWELSTVSLVQSGPFLTPMAQGFDQSNTNLGSRSFNVRPDRIGNGNLPNPTPDRYFDQSAFALPPAGVSRFGTSGAGVLVGPGTIAIAAGMAKTFSITERARLRLEGTFTNLPNHPNFLPPGATITQPIFGRLTSVQSAENSGNRTGQIAARIDF